MRELEETNDLLREKNRAMTAITARMEELERQQFNPRMQYLQEIEIKLKEKLTELVITDEKMEVCSCSLNLRLDSFAQET
jgi:hypothetical protein